MTFTINGIIWHIVFVNARSEFLRREDGTMTIGMTDGNTNTIYIADILKGRLFEKVLAHELVHAIMFSYDIRVDEELEETIAQWVSNYGREVVYILDDIMAILANKWSQSGHESERMA